MSLSHSNLVHDGVSWVLQLKNEEICHRNRNVISRLSLREIFRSIQLHAYLVYILRRRYRLSDSFPFLSTEGLQVVYESEMEHMFQLIYLNFIFPAKVNQLHQTLKKIEKKNISRTQYFS